MPASAGLAAIALSSFMDRSLSRERRGAEFGDRAAKAGVTGAAAKAALAATQAWWLGLAVGVGSRWLAAYGGDKRQRYETLRRMVERAEGRARGIAPPALDRSAAMPLGR